MEPVTLRFKSDTIESLDDEADESGQSRAEYIREVVRNRHEADKIRTEYEAKLEQVRDEYEAKVEQVRGEHEGELERLRSDLEQAQTDIERLRNEKQMLIADRQEKQELVEYVEEERSWREQPLRTRLKWWMFGKGAE